MQIEITKEKVESMNVDFLRNLSLNPQDWDEPGKSEYKLYSHLSSLFNNTTILDIGTRTGGSALALSYNENNKVISYDLIEQGVSSIKKSNIIWKITDFMNDADIDLSNVSIIMIDVDPHDGTQERVMMDWLKSKNWKGILILDDIGPEWPEIQKFWNEIEEEKIDATAIGHASGTGIINFGNKNKIILK
jgi:hypothetical protein